MLASVLGAIVLVIGGAGILAVVPAGGGLLGGRPHPARSGTTADIGATGVSGFEQNLGQDPDGSLFLARSANYSLSLAADAGVLTLRAPTGSEGAAVRLSVAGGRPSAAVEGVDRLPGVVNELKGSDPAQWRRGIPTFASVAYRQILPGVDLVFHGRPALEYDFVVAPGADPASIRLQVAGAQSLRVDRHGDLLVKTAAGVVTQHRPAVYQDVDGRRAVVAGDYRLAGDHQVRFTVGPYDHARRLVIDPVITFSTQVPGSGVSASRIAVDSSGASYVTGALASARVATKIGAGGGTDAFVAKLKPDGTQEYLTVLGGAADDGGNGIAVDGAGKVFITGGTHSTDFPTTPNAFAPTHACPHGGCALFGTAFVTALDSSGQQLTYSSYFGGSGPDAGIALALSPGGGVYVAGQSSYQSDLGPFPTKNAFRPGPCQCSFPFGWVARFDPSAGGSGSLVYSTLLTDPASNAINAKQSGTFVRALAVDSSGAAYVGGIAGPGFQTTPGSFQPSDPSGLQAGFLAKVSPDGTGLVYSTHLGQDNISVDAVAVDASGNAYLTGRAGAGLPTAGNPQQASPKGGDDAFLTKVDPNGAVLVYSSYLGGSGTDYGDAIAVDASGMVLVGGHTDSSDFPAVNPIPGQASTGAFVAKFDMKTQPPVIKYAATLGGGAAVGVAFGPSNSAYVVEDSGSVVKLATLPVITSLSQNAGPTAGATSVTITGTDFDGATSVAFGAVALSCGANAACQLDQQHPGTILHVTSPAHLPETVDVRVTTADGTSQVVAADQFTYRSPVVTAIDVTTGPATGGIVVHLSGSDLQGSTVQFGPNPATGVAVTPDGSGLVATTPINKSGPASVGVTTPPGATAAAPSTFTYIPAITGILPASGSLAGGDSVVILGQGFNGATDVRFGSSSSGTPIAPPGRDDQLVVSAIPSHAQAEAVAVTVTAQGLDSIPVPAGANMFSYTKPAVPSTPPNGPTGSGTSSNNNGSQNTPATPPSGSGTVTSPGGANNPAPSPGGGTPAPAPSANAPASGAASAPSGGPAAAVPSASPSPPVPAAQAPGSAYVPGAQVSGPTPLPGASPSAPVPGAQAAASTAPPAGPGVGIPAAAPTPPAVASPAAPPLNPAPAASPTGNPGAAAPADPAGPERGAPGYSMVAHRHGTPMPGIFLALFGTALAAAFGCLVLVDQRRAARGGGRLAYAGTRSPRPDERSVCARNDP